jgi:PAS domain S-box-containing protein
MVRDTAKILLVEDEEAHAELVKRAFQQIGWTVNLTWASSLREATARLEEFTPDLVIADWVLPDGMGTDLLLPHKEDFPLVLMTSHGSEQVAVDAMKAGALDYVVKSVPMFEDMPRIARRALREWRLLREKESVEKALQESEQRFRLLTENSLTGVFVRSLVEEEFIYVNPRFAEIHGYKVDEMMHTDPWQYVHPDDREALGRAISLRLQGKNVPSQHEFRIVTKNGEVRWIRALVTYVEHEGHAAETGNIIDITDQRMAEQELKKGLHKLSLLNDELKQFAYVTSHDLKEPLRTIVNGVQLLENKCKGQLGQDADELIGFVTESAARMVRLIDDILAYSRVGARGAAFASVDSDQILESTIRALETTIQETAATITHDPLPTLSADAAEFGLLFQNLILNGIKFCGGEIPRVHVSSRRRDGEWLFSVRDNGIGIEPEYREKIFVIFQRLHSRSEYPGTGIGLAIAKKIVERHRGRIWVESEPGVGSTFYFTIPDKN